MNGTRAILPSMPALGALIALAAGISMGIWCGEWLLLLAGGFAAVSLGAYYFGMRRASALALFFVVGIAIWTVHSPRQIHIPEAGLETTFGCRVTSVHRNDFNQRLTVEATSGVLAGCRVLVYFHALIPIFEQGDILTVRAALQRPDAGYKAPDEFSMEGYCRAHGIVAVAHCAGGDIYPMGYAPTTGDRIAAWRHRVSHFIFYKSGLNPEAAEMLNALLTGEDNYLDAELRADFASAGIAHVLALSGTHLSVIALMLSLLLFPIQLAGHRRVATFAMLSVLWGYVVFTGLSPSVVRAAIMVTIVMAGRMLDRGAKSLNSLCVAAILILVFNPYALMQPGFQLSFAAVACILMFADKIRCLGGRSRVMRLILGWVGVCTSAVAGTALLSAWHFHEFPLLFLAANLPVGLLMPVFMLLGVVQLVLVACGVGASWIVAVLNGIYGVMTWTGSFIANSAVGAVAGLYFSAWWLLPYFAVIAMLWVAWEKGQVRIALYGGCVAAAALLGVVLTHRNAGTGTESYAIHDYYATTLLLRDNDKAWLLTDASPKHFSSLKERMDFRFSEFRARRKVGDMEAVNELSHPPFSADGRAWKTPGAVILLLNRDFRGEHDTSALPSGERNEKRLILLVTVGFRGDVVGIARQTGASLTAISRRISVTRSRRLAGALAEAGLPYSIGLEGQLDE